MADAIDWHERRNELCPDQVFRLYDGDVVKLDRRVPSDGTQWYAANFQPAFTCPTFGPRAAGWIYDDCIIEPGDLVERLPDDYAGDQPAA